MNNINWSTVERNVDDLTAKIRQADVEFDGVVGILRGGVIPARLLVAQLAIADMYALNVKKRGSERIVTTNIDEDLSGRHLLLVEDVLESGGSLLAAEEYLEEQKRAIVGTVAIYFTAASEVIPDFTLGQIDEVPHFPWDG